MFQAFPLGKSVDEAIASIGWWARQGVSMISRYQVKHQQVTSSTFSASHPKDLILSSLLKKETLPPLLFGRRHRSIPG